MKRKPSPAEAEHLIDRAQAAAQSGAMELLMEREAKVLNGLVSAHSAGKLSDRDAAIGIAVIAEFRSLIRAMQRAVSDGIAAGESLSRR